MMNRAIIVQIGAVPIDRLLEITDHAEMAWPWRRGRIFQPAARRLGRTGNFRKDGKLCGIGVLRLVQNNAEIFFAQTPCCDRMLQQFVRQSDLVRISDEATLDAEIAKIALYFGGDAERGLR